LSITAKILSLEFRWERWCAACVEYTVNEFANFQGKEFVYRGVRLEAISEFIGRSEFGPLAFATEE